MSKRRSPSKTRPASRPPIGRADHVLDAPQVQAVAGDLGLVDLDVEERQARGLLDLHVRRAGDAAQDARRSGRRRAASARIRRRTP